MLYRYDNDAFDQNANPHNQQRRTPAWMKFVSVGLAGVLVGSIVAVGALESKNSRQLEAAQEQIEQLRQELAAAANLSEESLSDLLSATSNTQPVSGASGEPVVAIANACQPSIVGVTTMIDQSKLYSGNYNNFYNYFFGFDQGGQNGQTNNSERPMWIIPLAPA
jgi:hypothetical protein